MALFRRRRRWRSHVCAFARRVVAVDHRRDLLAQRVLPDVGVPFELSLDEETLRLHSLVHGVRVRAGAYELPGSPFRHRAARARHRDEEYRHVPRRFHLFDAGRAHLPDNADRLPPAGGPVHAVRRHQQAHASPADRRMSVDYSHRRGARVPRRGGCRGRGPQEARRRREGASCGSRVRRLWRGARVSRRDDLRGPRDVGRRLCRDCAAHRAAHIRARRLVHRGERRPRGGGCSRRRRRSSHLGGQVASLSRGCRGLRACRHRNCGECPRGGQPRLPRKGLSVGQVDGDVLRSHCRAVRPLLVYQEGACVRDTRRGASHRGVRAAEERCYERAHPPVLVVVLLADCVELRPSRARVGDAPERTLRRGCGVLRAATRR